MKDMTIKELALLLQKRINSRLKPFNESTARLKMLYNEIEEIEKKMFEMIKDLEPVESLIYNQNPELESVFESIKRIYKGAESGTDREIN
jgi:hypothetical protein